MRVDWGKWWEMDGWENKDYGYQPYNKEYSLWLIKRMKYDIRWSALSMQDIDKDFRGQKCRKQETFY